MWGSVKKLIRTLEKNLEANGVLSEEDMSSTQRKYSAIIADAENHTRSDYRLAMLEMDKDYFITGIPRFVEYFLAYVDRTSAYFVPVLMMAFEVVFITDMIGVTSLLAPYFNGNVVKLATF